MPSPLAKLVETFTANPVVSGKAMRQLLEQDPKRFLEDALPLLKTAPDQPGFYHLMALLQSHDLVLKNVCDPALFTTQQAIALARHLARVEPHFELKLAKALLAPKTSASRREIEENARTPAGRRLLEILAAISGGAQSLLVAQLVEHPDAYVRSKAALLVGKGHKNASWVQQRLLEKDARVRANALEALWGVQSDDCRAIFWSAIADPDNRVAGNALLGLHQLGEPATIPLILEMTRHAKVDFQRTAIWVMGESGDLRFLPWLEDLLRDPPSALRTHAFHASMKLKQRRSRLAALAALEVQVLPDLGCRENSRELYLSIGCDGEASLAGLKPTQFAVWENGQPINDFEVNEYAAGRALSVGFVFPHIVGPLARQEVYGAAFRRCLELKRGEDSWMMLKYGWNNAEASLNSLRSSDVLVDAQDAEEMAGSPKNRGRLAGNLWQAAAILIRSTAGSKGASHVIVIDDGSSEPPGEAELTKLKDQAITAGVAVHALSKRTEVFETLCAETGGRWMSRFTEEALPDLLYGFYKQLVGHYQLRFPRPAGNPQSAPAEIKLQICDQRGLGEATLLLS